MGSVALEGFGGGSNPLNFRVIGNPRPETAKENTIWIDTDTEISSWALAFTEHEAMSSGRNFLSYPYLSSTTTVDGIHFEDNKDGSVTVNGTKKDGVGNPQFAINSGVYLQAGNYYVSGCPKNVTAMVLVWDADNNFALAYDAGNGARFDLGSPRHVNVVIEVTGNQTISNAVFNPRITSLHGMVWITCGASGNVGFNAMKKNGIQIYPLSAKQFISGAWVDKTAKNWQGGEWTNWTVMIPVLDTVWMCLTAGAGGNAEFNGHDIALLVNKGNSTGGAGSSVVTKEKMDLSQYSTMEITLKVSAVGLAAVAVGVDDYTSSPFHGTHIAEVVVNQSKEYQTVSVPLDSISSGYVYIRGENTLNSGVTSTITILPPVLRG